MLAGILFQLGTMTIFSVLALDFIVRVIAHRPYSHLSTSKSTASSAIDQPPPGVSTPTDVEAKPADGSPITAERASLKRIELLLAGVAFASLMIYVRGVYRSIELDQGWSGYLITHENYFTYLDGLPMTFCIYAFAFLHPGFLLPRRRSWRNA